MEYKEIIPSKILRDIINNPKIKKKEIYSYKSKERVRAWIDNLRYFIIYPDGYKSKVFISIEKLLKLLNPES